MTESADGSSDEIHNVADLLRRLSGTRASGETRWYRGQGNYSWLLQPPVARNRGFLEAELDMLKHFHRDALSRVQERPSTPWDWLFLAQHYGVPTRLLDWTENPLIGLYFAVEDSMRTQSEPMDGAFFELDPAGLNRASYRNAPRVIMFDEDEFLSGYLPGADTGPRQGPIAAVAARYFGRIVAQAGTFTVNHSDHIELERVDDGAYVSKVRVPAVAKPHILAELSDININASTVYPDLAHLADHVKGLYTT